MKVSAYRGFLTEWETSDSKKPANSLKMREMNEPMERYDRIRQAAQAWKNVCFVLTLGFVTLLGFASPLYAQSPNGWALKMFTKLGTESSHNFGNLALHAEAEHRFVFENIYKEDVEILSAQSNCGCTKVSVSKKIVKSKEKAEIIARVDTSGKVHTGKRKVTITVHFNRPKSAEVQLQIQAFIRSDVVFNPGNVEFGGVAAGREVSKKVFLEYHGSNPNWGLRQLKKTNPGIKAVAKPTPSSGKVKTYEVTITLKESAEPGYISDLVRFISNDGEDQSIFIPVHAQVLAPLTAKPSYFQLGIVHPGEEVSKNLVIRGSSPFKIEKITSTDSRLKFLTANQESVVHVVPVTFSAGDSSTGPFHQIISIKTTQAQMSELEIAVSGFISDQPRLPRADSTLADMPNDLSNAAGGLSPAGNQNAPAIPPMKRKRTPEAVAFSARRGPSAGNTPTNGHSLTSSGHPFGGILPTMPAAASEPVPEPVPESTDSAQLLQTTLDAPKLAVPETNAPKANASESIGPRTVVPSPLKINLIRRPFADLSNAAIQPVPEKTDQKTDPREQTAESDDGFVAVPSSPEAAPESPSADGWVAAEPNEPNEPNETKNRDDKLFKPFQPLPEVKEPSAEAQPSGSGLMVFRKPALAVGQPENGSAPQKTESLPENRKPAEKTDQPAADGATALLLSLPE